MKYTTLPTTDIKVSKICLGTMTWGRQNTQDEAFEQMDYALEQGVNFFDTAELYAVPPNAETYGKTETIIGNWFTDRNNRDQVVLASKVAGPGQPWIRKGSPITPESMRQALDGSLKRLQTDYIDLYQLHWPNRPGYMFGYQWGFNPSPDDTNEVLENIQAVMETMQEFIKAGKIKHYGLSNETAWGTMQYLKLAEQHNLPRPITIQNEYNLLYRLFEPDLHEISVRENIGLLGWSPLAMGILSGKYLDGARPEGSRWHILDQEGTVWMRQNETTDNATRAYMEIANKHGLDVCQMAIAFTLTRPFMTSSIIGATTMDHLETDIAAANLELSEEILTDIAAVRRQYPMPY